MGNTVVSTLSDEQRFFMHKGQPYNSMTIVKLSKKYIDTHTAKGMWEGWPIYQYARFQKRVPRQGYNATYIFELHNNTNDPYARLYDKYAAWYVLNQDELEEAVEEIIYPVEFHLSRKYNDTSGIGTAVAIYGAVLLGSFVFQQWYLIAGVATCTFINYLKRKLGK